MAWKVTFPGGESVNFDSLPPATFRDIAKHDSQASWYGVYLSPTSDDERMQRVLTACAEHLGIDPPAEPADMGEATARMSWFTMEQNIEDQSFVDGFPQTPDEPEMTSSSGAPGDSTGPQTKPDDSQ